MIRCSACSAENPDGARFCNQCGQRLAPADQVDAPPPDRSGYTPRHLVERVLKDRASMLGERKRVTVLFADIKGSTRLAEQAGAEAWHDILDRFFNLLATAVHRYEGTINQYTGDGIMALFGAPVAHEDHAPRAALAALEMQASVREFADQLRLDRGLNLTLRIGLNTGEVIVGRIGDDLRMDYTAQGVTVNLAARLEQICEPGRVYVSRSTANLLDGLFELRSLGETRVHGVEQAVEVFSLEGHGEHHSRLQSRLARGGSPFLGREAELAHLQAALAQAVAGRGRVVGVAAAAGVGKSRLCHEFLTSAEQRGMTVHRTSVSPYARHQPMTAPRALFLSRMGCAGDSDPAYVRSCIERDLPEDLRRRSGALAYAWEFAGVGPPGTVNESLALSLREPMLRELARYLPDSRAPQILLFEDLHYLDPITLEFVRKLADAVAGTRSLLLMSWREELGADSAPRTDELLRLGPLEPPVVVRLATEWLGTDPSLGDLAERIAERAAGNPFFVEEAVTALAEAGYLEGCRGRYRLLRPVQVLPIPDTVHALIAARIDRLVPAHKAVLQAASVIGTEFESGLLTSLVEGSAEAPGLEPALGALQSAGFLHGDGASRRFAQPLMREVAYGTQLEARRSALHARLARELERQCGGNPVQPLARSIAEHWALAGEAAQAGRWNLHAASWFGVRDVRIAAEQFQRAIEHLDRAPFSAETRRWRIAARAGLIRLAQFVAVDADTVDQAYAEARQLAADCGDPLCASELSISYGNEQLHRGLAERSAALVERGIRECPAPQRAALSHRFRLAILMSFAAVGRLTEGVELANWAGGSAWLDGPVAAENSLSRGFMAAHLAWRGHLQRANQDLDAAIRLTEIDGRSASWMHGLRVDLAWFSGDAGGVLEEADRALEQAQAFGSRYFRALGLRARGQALILLGRHAEALQPLIEALPMSAPGAEAYQFEAHLRAVLSEACLGLGQLGEAARHAEAGVASGQAVGGKVWELRAWLARLALPREVLDEAAAQAGFARARELVALMQARGVEPRLDELAAARCSDEMLRAGFLSRALQGYQDIGARAHAERLRAGFVASPSWFSS